MPGGAELPVENRWPAEGTSLPPPVAGEPTAAPVRRVLAWRQYGQFATVGFVNAAVDLGILNILMAVFPTTSRLGLTVENSLAVALAILNSYLWNTRWTFRRQADGSARQLTLFVAQSVLNIGINDLVLILTAGQVHALHIGPHWVKVNLAKGVAMAFASSMSFFVMRLVVFRPGAHRRNGRPQNQ